MAYSATMPGILPFITAAPGDAPGSTLQAGQPAYATGTDGKVVAVDTTTRTEQLTPSKHSSSSQEIEGEEAKRNRLQFEATSEAAKAALVQPMLPGYTIDPATGLEMKPPAPPQEPVAAVPADMQIPIGRLASVPAGRMPGMAANPDGTVSPALPVAAPVTHTRAEQEDVNARYVADQKAKQAEAAAAESVRIEKAKADAAANWMKDVESAKTELTRARKGLSDPGNKGFLNEVLQAFAQFAGAYSAGVLGGPNHAANIIQAKQQREFEGKKLELEAATENMTRVGASRAQIDKVIDDQWARFIAKQKLDLESVQSKANNLLSRFPNAQAEANKTITQEQLKVATKEAEIAKGIGGRVSSSGQSTQGVQQTTVTPGTREGVGKVARPTDSENKYASQAGILKNALDVLEKNVDIIPKVYGEMSSNVTQMEANSETAKSGVVVPWLVSKAREKGVLPSSAMAGLEKKFGPAGEAVAGAGEQANEGVMRWLSGGAITGNLTKGEEARARAGFSHVAGESVQHAKTVNANLRKLANTLEVLGGGANDALIARSMADIAAGKEPSVLGQSTLGTMNRPPRQVQQQEQPRLAAAPAPAPANLIGNELKNLTKEEREDYLYAKNNPKDPASASAIRKLTAKARGGK